MNTNYFRWFIIFVLCFIVSNQNIYSQNQNIYSQNHNDSQSGSALNTGDMDLTVDPNTDFYEYSNGNWLKNNPVPPQYSRWGTWSIIIERNQEVLRKILENATAEGVSVNQKGSIKQKLGDIYYMAMDTVTIEKEGMNPLIQDLARIDAIGSREDFMNVFSYMKSFRNGGLFGLYAGQDDKNSSNVIINLTQGGLGLPDRDYYTKEDEKSKETQSKYKDYIVRLFELIGYDNSSAVKQAQNVYKIENRLANASMTRIESSEPENVYHLMSLSEVKSLTPDFSWEIFFNELGLTDESQFSNGRGVAQPEFFKEMNRMLSDISTDEWKSYLKWNLIRYAADKLSTPFYNEYFDFNSKVLRGTREKLPRWKISIQFVESIMGEPLGQLFVEKMFTPKTKEKALEMVNNIKESFAERLKSNEWMSEETKKAALEKLSKITPKIGYPDKWKDYTGLVIDRGSFYETMKKGAAYNYKLNLDKIAKPVNKAEWFTTPQTVNAYYSTSQNEIVFPAGIMQPPFYDPESDDALNYGAIGNTIGHEITHGFDENGRKYDGDGNMRDWWTKEDEKNYIERTDKLTEQYDGYVVFDSLHVNGKLTLGENIADLGGVLVSFGAFEKKLKGKEEILIDGFTQQQRFFLAYARFWRYNSRPEVIRLLINSDSHSPDKFRVNGVLVNVQAFMKAFNGKEGDPMTNDAAKRVVIW